jgi:hypothetical protein
MMAGFGNFLNFKMRADLGEMKNIEDGWIQEKWKI